MKKYTYKEIVREVRKIVEKECKKPANPFGYGFWTDHILTVIKYATMLSKKLKADKEILELSALLHDIGVVKGDSKNHHISGMKEAERILKRLNYPKEKINKIVDCILAHRYRTGVRPETKEARILFDADKLDCLGAIGIARSFVWVGRNYAKIYSDVNTAQYIKDNLGGKTNGRIQDKRKHSPYIEFETKLKFLPDKLYTSQARKIAKKRTQFFKNFLKRLKKEIEGKI